MVEDTVENKFMGNHSYFSISLANDTVNMGNIKDVRLTIAVQDVDEYSELVSIPQVCKEIILKRVEALLGDKLHSLEQQIGAVSLIRVEQGDADTVITASCIKTSE